MSVRAAGGQFVGDDLLRPPRLETFDFKGSFDRLIFFLNGVLTLGDSDLVLDATTIGRTAPPWTRHTYSGYTYDYYYKRFAARARRQQPPHPRARARRPSRGLRAVRPGHREPLLRQCVLRRQRHHLLRRGLPRG